MDLGTKIKNIRYNNNLSQEKMAKMLQINRNYLSRIETNKSSPNAEILIKIAEVFNVSLDSLLNLNLDGKNNEEAKGNKIKKITQSLSYLSNSELDFILNMINVMSNNVKK